MQYKMNFDWEIVNQFHFNILHLCVDLASE